MKKRAVSPVIATVLLIALVTAAAAIVFLVVIPMLTPANAILLPKSSVDNGDGNFTLTVGVTAEGSDIIFNGTIAISPTVAYSAVSSTTPTTISNGATKDITVIGSFTAGVKYTLTLTFIAGKNEFTQIVEITPT